VNFVISWSLRSSESCRHLSQFRVLCYQTSLKLRGSIEWNTSRSAAPGSGQRRRARCAVSRLGLGTGKREEEAVGSSTKRDLGVNLLDTAAVYGTKASSVRRSKACSRQLVIATKAGSHGGRAALPGARCERASIIRCGSWYDYVDIFQLHGVSPTAYDQALDVIAPHSSRSAKRQAQVSRVTETAPRPRARNGSARVETGVDVRHGRVHMMHQNARTRYSRVPSPIASDVADVRRTQHLLATRAPRRRSARTEATVSCRWLADAPNRSLLVHAQGGHDHRGRLSLCAPRAGCGCRAVRHRRPDHLRANIASLLAPPLLGGPQTSPSCSAVSSASGSTRLQHAGLGSA